jgi:hypothetical protein
MKNGAFCPHARFDNAAAVLTQQQKEKYGA